MQFSTGSPEPAVPALPPLPRAFYARSVVEVARACIGKMLVTVSPEGVTAGRIVETEAYRGPEDLAAHSVGGRRTPRTEVMFGAPGHAYVFFVYGVHFQFNVVTGKVGEPHAVLIRGAEPILGAELMSVRRGLDGSTPATRKRCELTNGPGKLCRAFGIDRSHYGADLCDGTRVYLTEGPRTPARIARSPRIGVDYAGQWAARRWRFFDAKSSHVSRARASQDRRTAVGRAS